MSVINYNIRISGCTDSGNKELFRIIFPLTDKKDQIALLGFDSKSIEMKIDIKKMVFKQFKPLMLVLLFHLERIDLEI